MGEIGDKPGEFPVDSVIISIVALKILSSTPLNR